MWVRVGITEFILVGEGVKVGVLVIFAARVALVVAVSVELTDDVVAVGVKLGDEPAPGMADTGSYNSELCPWLIASSRYQ